MKNRRKIDEISILAGLGARGWLGDALGHVWNGLASPSWAVLAAKLAVLAAMLAVLDAKLAARDGPNDARSRPRAFFERESSSEACLRRFFERPVSQKPQVLLCVPPRSANMLHAACSCEKTSEIEPFRPPKPVPRAAKTPRNRARATFGERKVAQEHAKCYRNFKSEAERAGQSAERAHVEAV